MAKFISNVKRMVYLKLLYHFEMQTLRPVLFLKISNRDDVSKSKYSVLNWNLAFWLRCHISMLRNKLACYSKHEVSYCYFVFELEFCISLKFCISNQPTVVLNRTWFETEVFCFDLMMLWLDILFCYFKFVNSLTQQKPTGNKKYLKKNWGWMKNENIEVEQKFSGCDKICASKDYSQSKETQVQNDLKEASHCYRSSVNEYSFVESRFYVTQTRVTASSRGSRFLNKI